MTDAARHDYLLPLISSVSSMCSVSVQYKARLNQRPLKPPPLRIRRASAQGICRSGELRPRVRGDPDGLTRWASHMHVSLSAISTGAHMQDCDWIEFNRVSGEIAALRVKVDSLLLQSCRHLQKSAQALAEVNALTLRMETAARRLAELAGTPEMGAVAPCKN